MAIDLNTAYHLTVNRLSFSELRTANLHRIIQENSPRLGWSKREWLNALHAAGQELDHVAGAVDKYGAVSGYTDLDVTNRVADLVMVIDMMSLNLGVDLGKIVEDRFNSVSTMSGSGIHINTGSY